MTLYANFEYAVKEMHQVVSPYFARPEPRQRALRYMLGVSGITAETTRLRRSIASPPGECRTDGAQRLLSTAQWDEMAVRAKLVDLVLETAGPGGDLYLIEATFPKRGRTAVATEQRFDMACGRIEMCQNAVLMFYGAVDGCLFLVDVDLYVPRSWAADEQRRRRVKMPHHIGYRSKSRIATDMLDRAIATGLAPAHATVSLQCPEKPELLRWLHQRRLEYLAVLSAGEFRDLAVAVPSQQNGMVVVDQPLPAALTAPHAATAYCRSCSRRPVPSHEMSLRIDELRRMELRWQSLRQQIRISHYEVRGWRGWHRHMTLAMAVQIASQLARRHPMR